MLNNLKEYEMITLEDGVEYAVAHELENYVLLVNPQNVQDFCIRKNVIKDGKEFIESLDSDEEFDDALELFSQYLKI
ncbi:MAG: hypothetical protein E7167_00470 [Firmicutes bacterium]|nr:hypothetical protein [Bacillota bacterium]